MAKAKKQKPPKVPDGERIQVRARRLIDHSFDCRVDEHGRERLRGGTASSTRVYEIAGGKVVNVRAVDPLAGIMSLSSGQREAGKRYREAFEICQREGLKPTSWEMSVDGSSEGRSLPERIVDAQRNLAAANRALAYPQVQRVVEAVCGLGMSLRSLSKARKEMNLPFARESMMTLLFMGLDKLTVHYGIVSGAKRIDSGRPLMR